MTTQKKLSTCAHLDSERQHVHCLPVNDAPVNIELKLLPIHEVTEIVGMSRAAIYALMKLKKFPACRKISRASRWVNLEIYAWIAALEEGVQA